jgi:hypothetical protein
VNAHALARTALNNFIFESNCGGDLRAAYEIHGFGGPGTDCMSESTRDSTVQVVTLSIGSKDVSSGCKKPENLNNTEQPPYMHIG